MTLAIFGAGCSFEVGVRGLLRSAVRALAL
jgi:hypothetical protein